MWLRAMAKGQRRYRSYQIPRGYQLTLTCIARSASTRIYVRFRDAASLNKSVVSRLKISHGHAGETRHIVWRTGAQWDSTFRHEIAATQFLLRANVQKAVPLSIADMVSADVLSREGDGGLIDRIPNFGLRRDNGCAYRTNPTEKSTSVH
jgi:hypothetical protein